MLISHPHKPRCDFCLPVCLHTVILYFFVLCTYKSPRSAFLRERNPFPPLALPLVLFNSALRHAKTGYSAPRQQTSHTAHRLAISRPYPVRNDDTGVSLPSLPRILVAEPYRQTCAYRRRNPKFTTDGRAASTRRDGGNDARSTIS